MPDFDRPIHNGEIEKATARLPNIDIEITHHRAPHGDGEQFFINIQAVPSFEAFGRFLEATNPFALWAQASRLAWLSWSTPPVLRRLRFRCAWAQRRRSRR